jgi:hypothetical protein
MCRSALARVNSRTDPSFHGRCAAIMLASHLKLTVGWHSRELGRTREDRFALVLREAIWGRDGRAVAELSVWRCRRTLRPRRVSLQRRHVADAVPDCGHHSRGDRGRRRGGPAIEPPRRRLPGTRRQCRERLWLGRRRGHTREPGRSPAAIRHRPLVLVGVRDFVRADTDS